MHNWSLNYFEQVLSLLPNLSKDWMSLGKADSFRQSSVHGSIPSEKTSGFLICNYAGVYYPPSNGTV